MCVWCRACPWNPEPSYWTFGWLIRGFRTGRCSLLSCAALRGCCCRTNQPRANAWSCTTAETASENLPPSSSSGFWLLLDSEAVEVPVQVGLQKPFLTEAEITITSTKGILGNAGVEGVSCTAQSPKMREVGAHSVYLRSLTFVSSSAASCDLADCAIPTAKLQSFLCKPFCGWPLPFHTPISLTSASLVWTDDSVRLLLLA